MYRFPRCTPPGSLVDQVGKIIEEALESRSALACGDITEAAIEVLDCLHACETALRMIEQDHCLDIDELTWRVTAKNRGRGYYGQEA